MFGHMTHHINRQLLRVEGLVGIEQHADIVEEGVSLEKLYGGHYLFLTFRGAFAVFVF
jgi:hypothetical protein